MHFVMSEWFIGSGLDDAVFFVSAARNEDITFFLCTILIRDKFWSYILNVKLQLVINIFGEQKYLCSIYDEYFIFFIFNQIRFSKVLPLTALLTSYTCVMYIKFEALRQFTKAKTAIK